MFELGSGEWCGAEKRREENEAGGLASPAENVWKSPSLEGLAALKARDTEKRAFHALAMSNDIFSMLQRF